MRFKVRLSFIIYLLISLNLVLILIFIFLNKKEPIKTKSRDQAYSLNREKARYIKKVLRYKNGVVLSPEIETVSLISKGGEEDRFTFVGRIKDYYLRSNNVFLVMEIDNLGNFVFNLGPLERSIGVNFAYRGEIGRYTIGKVREVFKRLQKDFPIALDLVTDTKFNINSPDCNTECKEIVKEIKGYRYLTPILEELSLTKKLKKELKNLGYVSQVVLYVEKN